MAERIHLVANNPDLGGGEQMLVRTASALLDLGHHVAVVAPDSSTEVLDAAALAGAEVVAIRSTDRRSYMQRLRSWDRGARDSRPPAAHRPPPPAAALARPARSAASRARGQ